MLVHVNEHVM